MQLGFDLHEMVQAFFILFAMMNVPAVLPIVINLEKENNIIKPAKAGIVTFVIFVLFFFGGKAFLHLFGISLPSFSVAGAIVIFLIALKMILNIQIGSLVGKNDKAGADTTIVPVVFPLIADAGTLTTLLTIKSYYGDINILSAAAFNCFLVYIFLKMSKKIEKTVNIEILKTLQKIFGIILLAIAVELFIDNTVQIIENYNNIGKKC